MRRVEKGRGGESCGGKEAGSYRGEGKRGGESEGEGVFKMK